jgi:hypothetical protein
MPNDPAAPVVLAILKPRLAVEKPAGRNLNRTVLLIAADDLDGPPRSLLEQREVSKDVQK